MRTLCISAILAGLLVASAGCPPKTEPDPNGPIVVPNGTSSDGTPKTAGPEDPPLTKIPPEVDVEMPEGATFPELMVGMWSAPRHNWMLELAPDGRIASAMIPLGQVAILPGERAVVPMIDSGQGIYEPGQWTVQYDPASEELTVVVTMRYVRVTVLNNVIIGKSRDAFVGQVSPDGQFWEVKWTGFPAYWASTDAGLTWKYLGVEDEYGSTQNVVFEKLVKQTP